MDDLVPLRYHDGCLELLEQTLLPAAEVWLPCHDPEAVAAAIRRLAVRGAPALGVAGAWGVVLGIAAARPGERHQTARQAAELLRATRPTAVNLGWALDEVLLAVAAASDDEAVAVATATAGRIEAADREANRTLAGHGAPLLPPGGRVLTHCNAGALATAGIGTALGVIAAAHRHAPLSNVWVDETRPLLQGARLTAWELGRLGVPYQIVTDSMVGALMARGLVDAVVVGSDRIAANGDVANKIGTYTVAVLAARHQVPFYVAAPTSTVDPATATGRDIAIEERDQREVLELAGHRIAPAGAHALNWAFDVTPAELVTAIITEAGIATAPYGDSLRNHVAAGRSRGVRS
jgi:methylthioribose-1-phosphate isomerase